MRAALLLGASTSVPAWQFYALERAIEQGLKVSRIFHCTDSRKPKYLFRHASYYLLVLLGRRRMPMLRSRDVSTLISENVKTVHFESEWEGNWQRLPPRVVDALSDVDVVVKFGMNLLRDAEQVPCQYGVVGYHHGDPRKYRGRPAGFYEMLHGESVGGVIIQRLSNSLDAGKIMAAAYSRVIPSSYATTLNEAYHAGIPL